MAAAGLIRTRGAARPLMRLITMSGLPILRQLHLEERLLRFSGDNWCIINDGTAPATIVMGVYGNLKFGGNAQSITKNRWVHHTSFLWDYDVKNMDYLKMPKRAPEYRLARKHTDFLCRMKEYMPSRSVFRDGVITALRHFSVQTTDIETVLSDDDGFVPATKLLSKYDQEEIVSSEKSLRV